MKARFPGPARRPRHGAAAALLFLVTALGVVAGRSPAAGAELSLTWIDNSGGEAGYNVFRATGATGSFVAVAQEPPGTTAYVDTAVTADTTYCYVVQAFNGAGVSDYSNEACGTPAAGFDVAVVMGGTGSGTVASSPAGIACETDCSESYPGGTVVTLTATPASGSAFAGWSSGGCSGTDPCTLAGTGSVVVTSTFDAVPTAPLTDTLTVSKDGSGTVTSSPDGITCGTACSATYAGGTTVTLTAMARRGWQFTGWSGGGCSGTGSCVVTLDTDVSVVASFGKNHKQ